MRQNRYPGSAPAGLHLAEVIRAGLSGYAHTRHLPLRHWQILNALQQCRTFARGAHRYACRHCHQQHVAPHACGNRHCPDCQGINSRCWQSPPRCPHCGSTDLELIEIIKPRRPDPQPEPIDTS